MSNSLSTCIFFVVLCLHIKIVLVTLTRMALWPLNAQDSSMKLLLIYANKKEMDSDTNYTNLLAAHC